LAPTVKLDIAISSRVRTNQTAAAFVAKLFEKRKEDLTKNEFDPKIEDRLTDFHTICEDHLKNQGVFLKKPPQYKEFLKSETMESVRQSVSKRLGLSKPLDPDTFKVVFRGCAFGHAIFGDDTWCSAFSNKELRLIELLEDLDDYFGDGYGRNINTKAPCTLTHDIITKFKSLVDNNSASSDTTYLRFSHAGAIKQLISYLGIYDVLNMNMEPGESGKCRSKPNFHSRDWRSSILSPFSANFVFSLYKCQGTQGSDPAYKVLTTLQEEPVKIRGCPTTTPLCPFNDFSRSLSKISFDDCRHDILCRL
jgi:hypothetical protein